MNPARLTEPDFAELARRWEGTPQHANHMIWQSRIRAQQEAAQAPVPAPAPEPRPAAVQWSLFD